MSIRRLLKTDRIYTKQMARILRMESKDEAWADELHSMHISRGIGALSSKELLGDSQRVTIDSNLNNQAIRTRAAELKMRAMRQQIAFSEILDYLKKYILAKYNEELKVTYKGITERRSAVDNELHQATKIINRLKHVIDIADIVIEDCESAGYTLHRIGEMLKTKARD